MAALPDTAVRLGDGGRSGGRRRAATGALGRVSTVYFRPTTFIRFISLGFFRLGFPRANEQNTSSSPFPSPLHHVQHPFAAAPSLISLPPTLAAAPSPISLPLTLAAAPSSIPRKSCPLPLSLSWSRSSLLSNTTLGFHRRQDAYGIQRRIKTVATVARLPFKSSKPTPSRSSRSSLSFETSAAGGGIIGGGGKSGRIHPSLPKHDVLVVSLALQNHRGRRPEGVGFCALGWFCGGGRRRHMTGGLKSRRDAVMASAMPMSGSHMVTAWGGHPARACSKNRPVLASVSYKFHDNQE
ncbi:uncharacterized protein [Triticum aestivum]|uniref:uncharacterized protein n=1 Tax=Triticum aestivum TaxID=4565 RepID=UPI001D026395|nr:uncharacterized protein LOC123171159 [Triticum aestivum]